MNGIKMKKKKKKPHIREDCRKGQEAEFTGIKFEFVWREACKLLFSNLYKTIMF